MTSTSNRRIKITPGVEDDAVLHAFLALLDAEADIDAYVHSSSRTLRITPHTEITPTDHVLDDGRKAYVFRMGKPPSGTRNYIIVVTSVRMRQTAHA